MVLKGMQSRQTRACALKGLNASQEQGSGLGRIAEQPSMRLWLREGQ